MEAVKFNIKVLVQRQRIRSVVFSSVTKATCSNMKFNTKLLEPETLVQYNPGV